jgi:NAD(P)-dependent dehydrogenase (short-subunit alcohol dehydrogenase family)
MKNSLRDRVALVTGGGSGIGRAAALAFARAGARVVVSDVDPEKGDETVQMMPASSTFIQADVSVTSQVKDLIRQAVEFHGKLDCAFNNAGIEGAIARLHEYPDTAWDRIIQVNLKGTWLCMKYELRQMLKLEKGAIVNTSSTAGHVGSRGRMSAYIASKHGVLGLTRTAAVEYGAKGIRVNALCPGAVRTPMTERLLGADPERSERMAQFIPMARFGTPDEVAEAAVWLCSDAASYVNGLALPIDGGYLAH